MIKEPSFSIGLEEEYLLVDRETRDLISEAPPTMLGECEKLLKRQVTPEFLQSQIEVGTRVCKTLGEARDDLLHLRKCVSDIAGRHGLAIIASSTHPFATWGTQRHTEKQRYAVLARDMQAVAKRLLISGMHVHVGIDDDELRIDLMDQAAYALPHFLVLSTSSPFWEGVNTGLKSYRVAVWNSLPRTPSSSTATRSFSAM
jgi:carboxylate-amine ligase